ncbi:MAG TPA: hypothetical protein PLS15_09825 [Fimbriimonadaceae bacterium]|nr:hypothetical protein [Fimbriimonadaceae bacterium]HRE92644.1 hypothetical protein [Fimbriimonadaceae bacterium]
MHSGIRRATTLRNNFGYSLGLAALAFASFGCQTDVIDYPLDPQQVGQVDADLVLRTYNAHRERLEVRVAKQGLDPKEKDRLLREFLKTFTDTTDTGNIPIEKAYQYADMFRLAGDWKTAENLYGASVKWAEGRKDYDRFTNDALRQAWCLAELGQVKPALALARRTYTVPPAAKAPILFAVLYEITPAARGKGEDKELAKLIADACAQHVQVRVDPASASGQALIQGRAYHMRVAMNTVIELYGNDARNPEARELVGDIATLLAAERRF